MLVLENIRHTWEQGEFLYSGSIQFNTCQILKGKSGSGKSTLFHILAGLIEVQKGSALWFGEKLFKLQQNKLPIAIQYQDNRLFPFLSLVENIKLGWSRNGKLNNKQNLELIKMARYLNLTSGKLNLSAGKSSGGEQKRASILRALGKARQFEKAILLFDEPLAALDLSNQKRIVNLISKEQKTFSHTVIVASHQNFMWQDYLPLTSSKNNIKINQTQ